MQHMDPKGQAATIRTLKSMPKETLIVIEHGLSSEHRDQFDQMDEVQRGSQGGSSILASNSGMLGPYRHA